LPGLKQASRDFNDRFLYVIKAHRPALKDVRQVTGCQLVCLFNGYPSFCQYIMPRLRQAHRIAWPPGPGAVKIMVDMKKSFY
jgi:hypothetical protein